MGVYIDIAFDDAAQKALDQIHAFYQHKAIDVAAREYGRPIIERAKQIAPDSIETGTRQKWSKKYKDDPDWQVSSGQYIASKLFKLTKRAGAVLYVGAKYALGNKQQFNNSPEGRKEVWWGKPTGKIVKAKDRWIERAAAETQSQSLSAFTASLIKSSMELRVGR